MAAKNRRPCELEALEDRRVPATIRFDGSNLYVSNPMVTAGASHISVIEQANGSFQVLDGAANNGFYSVTGNINIQGNNARDTITVNVSATGLTGNLTISTGNGPSTVTVDSTAAGGVITGTTHINTGNGTSSVSFGATGLTETGSLYVAARGLGANTFTLSNGATRVLGQTVVTGFPVVTLGTTGDRFAGGITVEDGTNPSPSAVTLGGTDLGNFVFGSGAGTSSVAINGSVLGMVQLGLGSGANSVSLGGGAAAISLGNLNVTAGNGANSITLSGANAVTDLGSATLNLANGNNVLGTSAGFTVNNNMFITNGNGNLNATTNPFEAVVGNNLTVDTGNGNNSFTLGDPTGAVPLSVGGSFTYMGGNGGNNLTVNNLAGNLLNLNVHFGNNPGTGTAATSDVFTIAPGTPTGSLTGLIAWGVTSSAANGNAFVDNGYVFTNNITLINVPS